mgnify:CR=1 FL=1
MNLLYCPKSGSDDISLQSSRELMHSEITCYECDFSLKGKINEDDFSDRWNALKRKALTVVSSIKQYYSLKSIEKIIKELKLDYPNHSMEIL